MKTKVCVIGANGRMGSLICDIIESSDNMSLGGKITSRTTKSEKKSMISNSEVVIDFSVAEALMDNLPIVTEYKKPIVIGITGLSEKLHSMINVASNSIPILYTPNTSVGIAIVKKLLLCVGETLSSNNNSSRVLLKNYSKIKITDVHHKNKKDSPSGTAIYLSNTLSSYINPDIIDIESKRDGDVIGEHSVLFAGALEEFEIAHRAKDRKLFAQGAVDIALWLYNNHRNDPGLYTMDDVICV